MNYQGDPLGLQWLPMLALYSNIGNKANSHEKIFDLGTELQELDGKHDDAVIQTVNGKIDDLIQKGLNLSDADRKLYKSGLYRSSGRLLQTQGLNHLDLSFAMLAISFLTTMPEREVLASGDK